MLEKRLKQSFILKAISYILLPLFIIVLVLSSIVLAYSIDYSEARQGVDYYESKSFANSYETKLHNIYLNIHSIGNTNNYIDLFEDVAISDSSFLQDKKDSIYYSSAYKRIGINYLIYDKEANIYYTNLDRTNKTDTAEEIKKEIQSGTRYWNLINKQIDTNIEKISKDNITQGNMYEDIMNMDLDIYTSYSQNRNIVNGEDSFSKAMFSYNLAKEYSSLAIVGIVVSVLASLIMIIYLIISAGHKSGRDEIYLDWTDKLPLEILGLFCFIVLAAGCLCISGSVALARYAFEAGIAFVILSAYITIFIAIYLGLSIIKRIKTKQLFRNSIFWRVCSFIKRICLKIVHNISTNTKLSTKITIAFIAFIAISFILVCFEGIGITLLIGFWIYVYLWIIGKASEATKIQNALKNIYDGNTNIELNENELTGVLKEMAIYVNDIAGGFSNAVQESIKSERMKTELITNVSHDIKTPLTSIINYVDLLKKENIQNEKAKEYLEVLDSKSQRLKKLIEDLVDASKASSGNIKLEKQLININELMKQVAGEFEDRFKEKNLEIITKYLKEDVHILADNRYVYRIIENIYSNISKYTLENSRVYIDMEKEENKIKIITKNISKERLNITEEELMQRFVRGDSSRNTEGSGLGLSIARSLTELQGGKFDIYLDGDLFKVILEFEVEDRV